MAFAFDGSWKPIIAAILVGSIAKWLAKGFADHKNRVAIEADLVKKGLSPQRRARGTGKTICGLGCTTISSRGRREKRDIPGEATDYLGLREVS